MEESAKSAVRALPVLVADDQAEVREALRLLLKAEGIASVGVASAAAALEAARTREWACALLDLNYTRDTTSGAEGLALLAELRRIAPDLPLVLMTAWASVPLAVQAMRGGAGDFIEKPWDNARLLAVLRTQMQLGASRRQAQRLAAENALLRAGEPAEFIAESTPMRALLEALQRVARSDASVLLGGENGTGKGVLAGLLHAHSARSAQPLVKVNIGGLAESVFESELFGHVRGAYTDARSERLGRFELADGGTLFLDEVGNIPLPLQAKLLRVLEDGEFERLGSSRTLRVDVRIVAATNADLAAEVAAGRFRKDLLYRINTVELHVPPLRERRADILPMARAFLAGYGRRHARDGLHLAPSAERALLDYPWPGNVRELRHVMERAALLARQDTLEADALALGTRGGGADPGAMTLEQAERWLIERALARHAGHLQAAADALGITRQALYRRLDRYGLRTPGDDDARAL